MFKRCRGLLTLDDDFNKTIGFQVRQGGDRHLTFIHPTSFIGGILQVQRVPSTHLLPILYISTEKMQKHTKGYDSWSIHCGYYRNIISSIKQTGTVAEMYLPFKENYNSSNIYLLLFLSFLLSSKEAAVNSVLCFKGSYLVPDSRCWAGGQSIAGCSQIFSFVH